MEDDSLDLTDQLTFLLGAGEVARALELVSTLRPADAADTLESLDDDLLAALVDAWSVEAAAEVLGELEPHRRAALAERIATPKLADILDAMPPDEAADFLQEVDPEHRARLLGRMEREEASDVAELLDHPEDSAGRRMSQDFFAVGEHATADEVIDMLRTISEDVELIYYVYVLGGSEQLRGVVSLRRLITADADATVGRLMETDVITVRPSDDVEIVVDLVRRYNLLALPVTDDIGRMLGIVTVDDVLEAIEDEAEQDVFRFAGSIEEEDTATTKVWPAFRRRLPWLAVATIVELLLAYLLLRPLSKDLLVLTVAYIPLLVFIGGNTAVQAAARVLRRLLSGRSETWSAWGQARKEVEAGLLLALIAGGLTFPFLAIIARGWRFAAVVAPAVALTVVVGAALGATLPIILQRLSIDPAIASGPLLGSAMDIVSLLIYISLAITFARFILPAHV
ncbi:MAG: magnesium transporter [Actinomycetota bacterium]|nr:magnesium transporter [Actinomycetota bacterium]